MKNLRLFVGIMAVMVVASVSHLAAQEDNTTAGKHRDGEVAKQRKAAASEKAAERTDKAAERADQREARQARRIHEGIVKGYLTPDEQKKLQSEEDNIAKMETSFKADGKITKDEAKQLRDALDIASADIWAEKHDTTGNQKPVVRLGKTIIAKSSTTSQIEAGITAPQARSLAHDFRTMVQLKRQLSDDLSDADRTQKQTQYDTLLNKYFEVRS